MTSPQAEILAGLGSLIVFAKREAEVDARIALEDLYLILAKKWEESK